MGIDVQEGDQENESSKKLNSLKNLLKSLQKPEKRFIIGANPRVTAFEFDPTFHHLFMGFKNGEVLSNRRSPTSTSKRETKMRQTRKLR